MRRILILVAALALLTTACKIEINAELAINADQSGTVTMEIGYDDEILALAEADGGSPLEMLGDLDLEDAPGATTSTERRGDMNFTIVEVPVDDFTTLDGVGGGLTEGLTDDFQITFTEDLVTVRGATTLDDALGDSGDTAAFPPEMMAEFFSINIRITMPGKILDHNATSQDGNTLTWVVDLTSGALDISADSNPNESAGGSSSILIYALIGAAVLIAAALVWMRMKKGSGSPAAEAASAPPADDDAPPAPPPAE
jgi:hypothetical protein